MAGGERRQLFAGDRVADEHGLRQRERIEHGQDVVGQPIGVVAALRHARSAVAAARDAVDVAVRRQARGDVVEDVRRVAQAGEEHHRPPAPAPVEHFERDAGLDAHGRRAMGRRVAPVGHGLGGQQRRRSARRQPTIASVTVMLASRRRRRRYIRNTGNASVADIYLRRRAPSSPAAAHPPIPAAGPAADRAAPPSTTGPAPRRWRPRPAAPWRRRR